MKTTVALTTLAVAVAFLTGCSATAADNDAANVASEQEVTGQEPAQQEVDTSGEGFNLERFGTCADVAPFVDEYITGLVEDPNVSFVDQTGLACTWATVPDEASFDNPGSVQIQMTEVGEKPDFSLLESMSGFSPITDPWVTEQDGVAFSLTFDVGLAPLIATTVWIDGIEITASGAESQDMPSLDETAGLNVVKEIFQS